jgi:3-keto-disaccharide hydrolase
MLQRLLVAVVFCFSSLNANADPVKPTETVALFNGKNLDGLTTWLRDTKKEDPRKVFSVQEGNLRLSGDGFGYAATVKEYRDYHVTLEFKWGKKTDGGKNVRNSGLLLNAIGPDGGAGNGTWMSCIECQLAQGCVGDLITIRGKDEKNQPIPVSISADVVMGPDKRPRWKEGGTKTVFTGRQLWWNNHDPDFKELLDTRGKNDVESPLGEWTKVESICEGKTITIIVNGKTVNKAYDVFPAAGKILVQTEGFELFVRKWEIGPIKK